MKTKLKIALLTVRPENYSSRRILEAGTSRGHEVYTINTLNLPVTSSNKLFGKFLEDFDAVIPRIGGPIADYSFNVIRALEQNNIFSTASSYGVRISKDKFQTAGRLFQAGLTTPKTVCIAKLSNYDRCVEYLGGLPVILKFLNSSQGRSVIYLDNQYTALPLIEALILRKEAFLLQEFVKEANGSDLRCFIVDGKVVGSMMRTAQPGEFRSNVHQGGTVKKARLTREERRVAIKAAKILKLNVAGVDILRSESGPKILEVNSSPGLEGIERATGKDIAGAIIECIESNVPTVFRTRSK